MRGMHPVTGQIIEGVNYLKQRLADVLTTPKGSRVMRREYGCGLFQRLDENMNPAWLVLCYQDIAEAIANPVNGLTDFQLTNVKPVKDSETESGMTFQLTGNYLPLGQALSLNIPVNALTQSASFNLTEFN